MLHFPRWKIALIGVVCLWAILGSIPNMLPRSFTDESSIFGNRIELGLDLRGGSYLLLEVDLNHYMDEQIENLRADIRQELRGKRIDDAPIRYKGGIKRRKDQLLMTPTFELQRQGIASMIEKIADGINTEIDAQGQIIISFSDDAKKKILITE